MGHVNTKIEKIFPFFFGLSGKNCGLFPQQFKEAQLLLPPAPVAMLLAWTGPEKKLLGCIPCRTGDDG